MDSMFTSTSAFRAFALVRNVLREYSLAPSAEENVLFTHARTSRTYQDQASDNTPEDLRLS